MGLSVRSLVYIYFHATLKPTEGMGLSSLDFRNYSIYSWPSSVGGLVETTKSSANKDTKRLFILSMNFYEMNV